MGKEGACDFKAHVPTTWHWKDVITSMCGLGSISPAMGGCMHTNALTCTKPCVNTHYWSVSLSLAQKKHANVHLYRPNIPQQSLYILHVLLHYNYEVQQWAVPEGVGVEFADLQGLQAIHRGCQFSASGGPDDLLTNHDHMPSLPANNMHTCLPEKQPYNAHNAGNTQHLFKLEKTLLTGRVLDSFLECYHPL